MPGKHRVSGDTALLFLADVREHLALISLDGDEYYRALEEAAGLGLISGAIYDALIGACAAKSRAESIYTWNTKVFLRLTPSVAGRVTRPDQAR